MQGLGCPILPTSLVGLVVVRQTLFWNWGLSAGSLSAKHVDRCSHFRMEF